MTNGDRVQPHRPGEEQVYRWYQQGCARLGAGQPGAAAEVLELAVEHEPGKASIREALGRAYFASAQVEPAREQFAQVLEHDPSNDYAHFGLGRCFERQGRLAEAAKHYKLACALADRDDYRTALRRVRHRLQD